MSKEKPEQTHNSDRINNCISCGSSEFHYHGEHHALKLPMYICTKCGLYVTGKSQKELDSQINSYYKKEFWDQERNNYQKKPGLRKSHSKNRLRNWVSQYAYCKEFFKNKKTILEIGSGQGEAIINFDKLGFQVLGVEPDETSVENINSKLNFSKCVCSNIENLDLTQEFDAIWMSHVFEHLTNPIDFLKKIRHLIKKDGFVFLEVPSVEKKNDWRKFQKAPHAYNYSRTALMNIVRKGGFNVVKCDYFRSPTKLEGIINKIFVKLKKRKFYQYYPKIKTDADNGWVICTILTKK